MFAHLFVFPETEKCFRNAIFTHSVRNARNVQYSLVSSEASVCERCSRVDVRPPFCFPRNREMLRTRDDDQLSEIFTHNINARNARNVQYSLKWKVFGTFRHCGLQTARSVPRWRGLSRRQWRQRARVCGRRYVIRDGQGPGQGPAQPHHTGSIS